MDLGSKILSDVVVYSKYARYIPELNRRESWDEIVDRSIVMHTKKFPFLHKEIENAFQFVKEKKVLPSMRALQFAGKPIEISPAKIYNCSLVAIDSLDAFSETMFLLLSGTGVGFSVQKHHIDSLPPLRGPIRAERDDGRKRRYLIGDSIEGWADAVKILIESYFLGKKEIEFDFRDIRPKGAHLSTSAGRAPGPQPLKDCLHNIEKVLDNALQERGHGTRLKPIEAHDILCHIADAVLAGGIRRAAMISFFDLTDEEMLTAKHGNWWELNPQRGRANNSAVIVRHKITRDVFDELWVRIKNSGSGEPGIIFTNDKNVLGNPCMEVSLHTNQFCLTGDTKILTENGYKELATLENTSSINVISAYPTDTPTGFDTQTYNIFFAKVHFTGVKEVFELKFAFGPQIRATENHAFLTQDGYVEVKDLNPDYHLVWMPSFSRNSEPLTPDDVNEYDFLGWLIGAGWYVDYSYKSAYQKESMGLMFKSEDDLFAKNKILSIFGKLLEKIEINSSQEPRTVALESRTDLYGPETIVISNYRIRRIAESFGLKPGTIKDKRVPTIVWNTEYINKRKFLSALFSASGTVQNTRDIPIIDLTLPNPTLAEEIQLLLTEAGVPSRVTIIEKKHNAVGAYITISGKEALLNFQKEIGFLLHPRKQQNLVHVLSVYKDSNNKLLKKTNWLRIKSITRQGMEPVYDVTVDTAHNFIANGIITHNCNLTTINAGNIEDQQDFLERCKAAAFIGTLQASYTDFHYLRDIWRKQTEKEALLGVSLTGVASNGFMNRIDLAFGARVVLEENERVAKLIGINKAARTTLIKPEGCGVLSTKIKTTTGIKTFEEIFRLSGYEPKKLGTSLTNVWLPPKHLVIVYDEQNKERAVTRLFVNGIADVYTFETADGETHSFTANHKFLTQKGWVSVVELQAGDIVKGFGSRDSKKEILITKGPVKEIGKMITVDIEVLGSHTYQLANGMISHNTSSLVVGTSSGVHPWYGNYYFRRMRVDKNEPLYHYFLSTNPEMVEDDLMLKNTGILKFPIKAPEGSITRSEGPLEMLERIKRLNIEWITPGHRKGVNKHNVSATVYIRENEWDAVRDWMWENREYYNGLSVLPFVGSTYIQMPHEECTKEEYEQAVAKIKPIDLTEIVEKIDTTDLQGELACSGDSCELKKV